MNNFFEISLWVLSIISLQLVSSNVITNPQIDCVAVMKNSGLSDMFGEIVAHGIHSLTVEDLRMFEPTATEKNNIPTVNKDLQSDVAILPNAPMAQSSPFSTSAMRVVDNVMSHMDSLSYDMRMHSTLEKLIHALHMKDLWSETKIAYNAVKEKPPTKQTCSCVRDLNSNGVVKLLRLMALKIREPGLMFPYVFWKFHMYRNEGENQQEKPFDLREQGEARKGERLESEDDWRKWKDSFLKLPKEDNRQLAMYLFCALNPSA